MKLFGFKKSRKLKVLRVIFTIIFSIVALVAGAWAAFEIYIAPPEVKTTDKDKSTIQSPEPTVEQVEDEGEMKVNESGRIDGMYTFLIAGEDNDAGGTDVMMIGRLDTNANELNLLSIPRDTMVNVPWETKKANSYKNMYEYLDGDYDNYIDALKDGMKNLIGYEVDSYITINLDGFVTLVDAINGVEFDVPERMRYADPVQGLDINLEPGVQTLNGDQAMQVIRYRRYRHGDLDRINVQHDFLMALAEQLISAKGLFAIDDMVGIFQEHVTTDMTYNNLLWYAKQFLGLSKEGIHFYTAANTEYNKGLSYVTLNLDEWIDQINNYINPFYDKITIDNLDIRTQDASGIIYNTKDRLDQSTMASG